MKVYRIFFLLVLLASCSGRVEPVSTSTEEYKIFPDYKEVTVPENIAPLNFSYLGDEPCRLEVGDRQIKGKDGLFEFGESFWKELMQKDEIQCRILVKREGGWVALEPFRIFVSHDRIDPYLSYRLVPPGYQAWLRLGLYQRNLENYRQTAIFTNRYSDGNCMNCHIPCNRDPSKTVFHARAKNGGTMLLKDGKVEKLNTKTDSTISALVYPWWHPDGRYIAFSVNKTAQSFFNHHPNRIEVWDSASDVVVYDTQEHKVLMTALLKTKDNFETFPNFSPDGKTLYFCSTKAVGPMPEAYADAHYDLMKIAFDASDGSFGDKLEKVYDASSEGKSVSFPRVSPDGKHLVFTRHAYGNFSIWHKDSDLWIVDLADGSARAMENVNSDDVDSYHSWSGNSRWMVFSSRRMDGLFTRLYICHIDEKGNASKPFLLPQKNPLDYYRKLFYSYNIPEFMEGKVDAGKYAIGKEMRGSSGVDISATSY